MRKLILSILFILCLSFQASAWNIMIVGSGTSAADPCTTMGASGTYEGWLNGEYPADNDTICLNSGASTAQPDEVTAGVVGAGGAINGNNGFLFDAANEAVRYVDAVTTQTLDNAGYIRLNVHTPATITHNMALAEIYTDGNNAIVVYAGDDTRAYAVHRGNADSNFIGDADCAMSGNTTYDILYTWNVAGDTHSMSIDGGNTWCDTDSGTDGLTAFAGTTDDLNIGESQYLGSYEGTDGWKIDDVRWGVGYEGP